MQFTSSIFIIFTLIHLKSIESAPADTVPATTDEHEHVNPKVGSTAVAHNTVHRIKDKKSVDYYEYRHVVADSVQKALDECRQKFKWDRWNCPKKAFLSIFDRDEFSMGQSPLPANKELALTRALIASSILLSVIRSCSIGANSKSCSCTDQVVVPVQDGDPYEWNRKFAWAGCDEIVKFGFKVAKMYLDTQDSLQGEASRLINSHNYEAGRQAVKKLMKRVCKCHGTSGACQVKTCWTVVPDISEVGDYLKRQYRVAAKVGAMTATETDVASLVKEVSAISPDKLVFADASPDYCYENKQLGINGTIGRYCSRAKHRSDGTEVSRSERDSCDRLCTKCGYKIKKERINVEKQCDCRFVYCCSVECKRCPHVEETFKCVRHS
jgi:hypothetical protein